MIPEIGQYAMILALLLAVAQAFFGLAGPWRAQQRWMQVVYPAVAGQFVLLTLAFGCLVWSFVHNDFTVRLVAGIKAVLRLAIARQEQAYRAGRFRVYERDGRPCTRSGCPGAGR